jgi:hypothetical protein
VMWHMIRALETPLEALTSSRDVAHDQGAGDASGGPDFLT